MFWSKLHHLYPYYWEHLSGLCFSTDNIREVTEQFLWNGPHSLVCRLWGILERSLPLPAQLFSAPAYSLKPALFRPLCLLLPFLSSSEQWTFFVQKDFFCLMVGRALPGPALTTSKTGPGDGPREAWAWVVPLPPSSCGLQQPGLCTELVP